MFHRIFRKRFSVKIYVEADAFVAALNFLCAFQLHHRFKGVADSTCLLEVTKIFHGGEDLVRGLWIIPAVWLVTCLQNGKLCLQQCSLWDNIVSCLSLQPYNQASLGPVAVLNLGCV